MKYWTKEEIDFLVENYSTLTGVEIADRLGRDRKTVWIKAYSLNLRRKGTSKKFSESDDVLLCQCRNYDDIRGVAEQIGRTIDACRSRIARLQGQGLAQWEEEDPRGEIMRAIFGKRYRKCIIPADKWDGDTGIEKLLKRGETEKLTIEME